MNTQDLVALIGFIAAVLGDVGLFTCSHLLWLDENETLSYIVLAVAALGAVWLMVIAWRFGMAL